MQPDQLLKVASLLYQEDEQLRVHQNVLTGNQTGKIIYKWTILHYHVWLLEGIIKILDLHRLISFEERGKNITSYFLPLIPSPSYWTPPRKTVVDLGELYMFGTI